MMAPAGAGPTIAQRLAAAADALASVSETPRLDAEILLAAALGLTRAQLLARLSDRIDTRGFDGYVERRLNYEPLAYILGEWEFFSLPFTVRPPLLTPRPETEHLVETVLDYAAVWEATRGRGSRRKLRVLEVGAGTGCVAVSIAVNLPGAAVVATDINPLAIEIAGKNAARHGVEIELRLGDLFDALEPDGSRFDVICSNPPYIEETAWHELSPVIRVHEDPRALLAGPDGLAVIRRLVAESPRRLVEGGMLAFELGRGQDDAVRQLLDSGPYRNIRFRNDLAGIRRIACADFDG